MIQNWKTLNSNIKEINSLIQGNTPAIQKIFSTARYICICLRLPGKSLSLYLGRGGGHEGIWLDDDKPPEILRRKDKYLAYLRSHIRNKALVEISLDDDDRIIIFKFKKYNEETFFAIFWKGRDLYFVEGAKENIFLSWNGQKVCLNDSKEICELFDSIGREKIKKESAAKQSEIKDLLKKERNDLFELNNKSKNFKKLQIKIKKINQDLARVSFWHKIQEDIPKLTLEKDCFEIVLHGWKIKFDKKWNEHKKKDVIYKKAKSLKHAENILKSRLENSLREIKSPQFQTKKQLKIITPIWQISKNTAVQIDNNPQNHFVTIKFNNKKCYLGLNTQGNDYIRSKLSSKEDLWFHIHEYKSAHLIINVKNLQDINSQELSIIASALAEYSNFKSDIVPIVYTQLKNVKGLKGKQGAVIYKKEKYLDIPTDKKWQESVELV